MLLKIEAIGYHEPPVVTIIVDNYDTTEGDNSMFDLPQQHKGFEPKTRELAPAIQFVPLR